VLAFFLLIGFVFWITSLHDRHDFERRTSEEPQLPLLPADLREAERTS
jgi:hypothetical protein